MDEKCKLKFSLIIISLLCGCATTQPPLILNTFSTHAQVLIVSPKRSNSFSGVLSAWENHNGVWNKTYAAPVVLGRKGIAALNAKREGDGYTPSGIYPIGTAFGYETRVSTGLNYRQATDEDFWVDDINSFQYNQWVHGQLQAKSFEQMKRKDNLYRLGAVIEYNTHPVVPGKGSAIFLHIWRAYYKPTAGCIALSQRNIRKLMSWLDKDKKPIIILTNDPFCC